MVQWNAGMGEEKKTQLFPRLCTTHTKKTFFFVMDEEKLIEFCYVQQQFPFLSFPISPHMRAKGGGLKLFLTQQPLRVSV